MIIRQTLLLPDRTVMPYGLAKFPKGHQAILTHSHKPPPYDDRYTYRVLIIAMQALTGSSGKTAPPPGQPGQQNGPIFVLGNNISRKTHALTNKTDPPPDGRVFKRTGTIIKLSLDIIRTHVLTKFYDDWSIHRLEKMSPGSEFLTIDILPLELGGGKRQRARHGLGLGLVLGVGLGFG
ncbi:hypothetical protein DPMN_015442 [Dreissena polymorpha]|uniref:Uncharacterized protein n=1 Tax=Dreissena polymorpha TaxID=45954 RepID=A0A9D4S4F1_DREPO|nr:hypothetical protein DPMN_015442 [Dreissena polymorpha]